ncbi:MAG: chemotaxis protein CheX [Desulfobulbaceae bacterium]|mgnify:FL=1|nr:MAG: chemotaxis protein CheX [Desulfobulbaceae bacterium]
MVMMEVSPSEIQDQEPRLHSNSISGVIGLAGKVKGVLAIHMPESIAFKITGSFLGIDVDSMNEDVEDAIGEIANMLGGNLKTILSDSGKDIDLSLPTTISGKEYDFQSLKNAEREVIIFDTDGGGFIIEIQLEA